MDYQAADGLPCRQEPAFSSDLIWKKYDDFAFEPLCELIAFVMFDSGPDG